MAVGNRLINPRREDETHGRMPILACEPIIPLMHLMTGSSPLGSAMIMKSTLWLLLAVVIKCGVFVCLEKRLSWREAALFMFLGNVISTVPGAFVSACASSPSAFFMAIPVILFLGWLTAPRLRAALNKPVAGWLSAGGAAIAFVLFFFLSVILAYAAENSLEQNNFALYWTLKFIFVSVAAGGGILLSSVLEEYVIARLARRRVSGASFYRSVLRANYVTLIAVLLAAAVVMLPKRLRSPHYIVSPAQATVSSGALN